jgi:uncharacterized protein (DUF1778 family)
MLQNRSLTEFAIAAMEEAAQKTFAEQTSNAHMQLSDRDRFLAMLDRDPTPNRALRLAAQRYRRRVV